MAADTGAREGEAHTAFTAILRGLVEGVSGAVGAIFIDSDGECVDYWGTMDPFDLKVVGAHGSIFMRNFEAGVLAPLRSVVVSASSRSLWLMNLGESYTLVLVLDHRSWTGDIEKNLECSVRAIRAEAGIR